MILFSLASSSSLVTLSTFSIAERTLDQVKGRPPVWGARPSHMENISVQASVWWGLLFSMAERQLSLMSRLSPTVFQFADTLGTTIFRSSVKDGFQLSRTVSSVEEEKPVTDPGLNKEVIDLLNDKQLSSVF